MITRLFQKQASVIGIDFTAWTHQVMIQTHPKVSEYMLNFACRVLLKERSQFESFLFHTV